MFSICEILWVIWVWSRTLKCVLCFCTVSEGDFLSFFFCYYGICAPPCLAFVTLLFALFIFIVLLPLIPNYFLTNGYFQAQTKRK